LDFFRFVYKEKKESDDFFRIPFRVVLGLGFAGVF